MTLATIINEGDSQIICFPPDFHLSGDYVFIKQLGNALVLLPVASVWDLMLESLEQFSADFAEERKQPADQDRQGWFDLQD